ncbi:hypothetical protein KR018_007008 [Drosophila ironensis]|nr:hypothetical protein KR018_007008 [Drosophila ironensis]
MFDPVVSILRFAYIYGRIVGVLNFEVDWRTGRAMATPRATLYAAVHNIGLIVLLLITNIWDSSTRSMWLEARFLHEYVFALITMVRTFAVLITLVSRWRQRCRILRIWNQLIRMIRQRPYVIRWYRSRILIKFLVAFLSDSMHSVLDRSAQRKKFTLGLAINLLVWYTFTTIFNMIVAQYYLAMLQIQGHYKILRADLRTLIDEADSMEKLKNRKGGVFATKCCCLADRLDELLERQTKLEATLEVMSDIFELQGFSMTLVYYLSTMGTIYYAFCTIYYNTTTIGLGSTSWGLGLIILSTAFFYADNWLTIKIAFMVYDEREKICRIIAKRTLFKRALDERLERSFENFQLQLAAKNQQFYVLGLFKVERGRIMAMGNSVITHSIMLIQWELQHHLTNKL